MNVHVSAQPRLSSVCVLSGTVDKGTQGSLNGVWHCPHLGMGDNEAMSQAKVLSWKGWRQVEGRGLGPAHKR